MYCLLQLVPVPVTHVAMEFAPLSTAQPAVTVLERITLVLTAKVSAKVFFCGGI
jgi:hypothetical protein